MSSYKWKNLVEACLRLGLTDVRGHYVVKRNMKTVMNAPDYSTFRKESTAKAREYADTKYKTVLAENFDEFLDAFKREISYLEENRNNELESIVREEYGRLQQSWPKPATA
jgi:hypothetical protein